MTGQRLLVICVITVWIWVVACWIVNAIYVVFPDFIKFLEDGHV